MVPSVRQFFWALLCLGLPDAAAVAAPAIPKAALIAEMQGEFQNPPVRCDWIARHFDGIDQLLSLYREDLASLYAAIDGARIADSATGVLQRAVFESRLIGPAGVTITIDLRQFKAQELLQASRQLEVGFVDARGAAHPLFCGFIALVQTDAGQQRADLVALIPRAGPELRASAQYQNKTELEVIKYLVQSAGIGLHIVDTQPRSTLSLITQENLATWPFLRSLAERLQMELVLQNGNEVVVTPGHFAPPPLPSSRQWNDQTWAQIVKQIARAMGRELDIQLTGVYPRLTVQQDIDDEEFLASLAAANQASAYWASGVLALREDRVWLPNKAARTAADALMTPLELTRKIANRYGMSVQWQGKNSDPVTVSQRSETDLEVLLRVLASNRLRLLGTDRVLYLQQSQAPGDVTDLLLRRVVVTGSTAVRKRSFGRSFADPYLQLQTPEQLATTEVMLDLGTAMPAVPAASFPLADASTVSVAFDAAIRRLSAQPSPTPSGRFLQDLARIYRPTLIHLHRLRANGVGALNAIAP